MGDDVVVTRKRRALIAVLTLVLALTACGDDGESSEERAAVVQMLERLGNGRTLAECMAEQFGGVYAEEDFQPMIDARGDFTSVDFELLEDIVNAQTRCTEDDS